MSGPATPRSASLDRLARALGGAVERDRPLGPSTTYRVGGPAALFVEVADEHHLLEVGRTLAGAETPVPVLVLGGGSNLLVADAGFRGLVVALGPGFDALAVEGTTVRAGAALSLPVLARRTAAAGLTGLEWAVGVPGTVGGAVRMNAGGHGSDTATTLVSARWIDLTAGTVGEAGPEHLHLGYRRSDLAPTDVVCAASFRLAPGDPDRSAATIAEIVRWRRANQPGGSNAGSIFTNPPGDSAGRLIDACGLKGLRIGSAAVSTKHANFIQADADGAADDVARLIDEVRSRVAARTGVELVTEVTLVGFAGHAGAAP